MTELVTYLTDAERDYLRQLFSESASRDGQAPSAQHTILLESQSVERDLLLRMLSQLHTELVATDGYYCLRFKLEAAPSPYGGPAVLRLSPPTVTDRQGLERPARVRPGGNDIELDDRSGTLRGARVIDISPSGVALRTPAGSAAIPGTQLADLQLKLPGREPFTVTGRIVRVENQEDLQQLALKFDELPEDAQAALRYYVFDNYEMAN